MRVPSSANNDALALLPWSGAKTTSVFFSMPNSRSLLSTLPNASSIQASPATPPWSGSKPRSWISRSSSERGVIPVAGLCNSPAPETSG
jgi:hypothetical protein